VTDPTRADRAHSASRHTGGIAGDPGFASKTLRAHDAIEMSDLVTLSSLLDVAGRVCEPRSSSRKNSSMHIAQTRLSIATAPREIKENTAEVGKVDRAPAHLSRPPHPLHPVHLRAAADPGECIA
jgi:hypothetical protein